ncbi:MAG: peptidylprolyl isomerase [Erysipelotrichaceae bacterium]
MKYPIASLTLSNNQIITLELYPEVAPNTVANFIDLANKGFYDGLIFHRVIPGFMVQGGCPKGEGTGNPGYSIKGEFSVNRFNNPLKHTRGVISMARSMDKDSAGCQFFIMVETAAHLDGQYAAFGRVIEGLEYLDEIVQTPRNRQDKPNTPQIIKSIRVETHSIKYTVETL